MKELLRQTLANLPQTPYSKYGDIFMEGKSDMAPQNSQPTNPEHAEKAPQAPKLGVEKPVSAEKQAAARKAWERFDEIFNKGKVLSVDERRTREEIIKRGLPPIAGGTTGVPPGGGEPPAAPVTPLEEPNEGQTPGAEGADRLNLADYTDLLLQNIVREINQEANRVGVGNPLGVRFINGQIERVRNLVDNRQISAQEGVSLLGELNAWMREAMEIRLSGESRYYQDPNRLRNLLTSRDARNEEFNDLFAGVDATPHEFFDRAFNPMTYGIRYEEFMDLIRKGSIDDTLSPDQRKDLEEDLRRYQTERRMRQTLHDVNAALYIPSLTADQLFDHMQQFGSDLGDVAFKTPGVRQMMDIYEQAIRESMADNNGYLKPESIIGEIVRSPDGKSTNAKPGVIEERTKERFKARNKNGRITVKHLNGQSVPLEELKEWELARVFSIARGMMITTERLISLAAESTLPLNSYSSVFLQDVVQSYSAYIHLLGKFGVSEKDLAAYLYQRNESQGPWSFLRRWNPAELEKALKSFEDNAQSFFENTTAGSDLRYLMLRNPNRAGDIFTWLSWRTQEQLDAVSMSQDFLKEGQNRMIDRFKRVHNIGATVDLIEKRVRIDYDSYLLESERKDKKHVSSQDVIAINSFLSAFPGTTFNEGDDRIKRIQDDLNEYSNWIGTALRLERLRTNLSITDEELHKLEKGDKDKNKKAGEVKRDRKKGQEIVKRMVDLQPHRLYLVSKDIRQRVDVLLAQDPRFTDLKTKLPAILNNLSIVESKLLQERETLLDKGETFSTVLLNEFYSEITDQTERELAQVFAQKVLKDFNDRPENYYDELASYKREYKHGFVLWSGDAPVDEFNLSALGPTAGFARRARDNKAQAEAIKEEIKLLVNLKNIKHPDEVIQQLQVIYDKIASYDAGKAKQAISEKAEGIAKFFAADFVTNFPGLGILMKQTGVSSFAQITYDDKSAGVWQAQEVSYFLTRLKQKNLITKEQFEILKNKTFARTPDVAMDIASTMGQFIALALALYLAEKLLKENKS